jgi:hypothetical protein
MYLELPKFKEKVRTRSVVSDAHEINKKHTSPLCHRNLLMQY